MTLNAAARRAGLSEHFRRYNMAVFLKEFRDEPDPKHEAFIRHIDRAVSCLAEEEQQILKLQYLNREASYSRDYKIYRDVLQTSKDRYRKIRSQAFANLRVLLGIDSPPYMPIGENSEEDGARRVLRLLNNVLNEAERRGAVSTQAAVTCRQAISQQEAVRCR